MAVLSWMAQFAAGLVLVGLAVLFVAVLFVYIIGWSAKR